MEKIVTKALFLALFAAAIFWPGSSPAVTQPFINSELTCKAALRSVVKAGKFGEQRSFVEALFHFIRPNVDIRDPKANSNSALLEVLKQVFQRAYANQKVSIMDQGAGQLVTIDEVAEYFWKATGKRSDEMTRFHFWAVTFREGFLGPTNLSKWKHAEDGRPANLMTGIFGKFFEDLLPRELPNRHSLDLIFDLLGVFSYSDDPGYVLNKDIELSKPDGIILIRTTNDTVITNTRGEVKIIDYLKFRLGEQNVEGWLQHNPDLLGFSNSWDWMSPRGASIIIRNAGQLPRLPSLLRVKVNDEWVLQEG